MKINRIQLLQGMTFLELAVALIVFSILVTIAVPKFYRMVERNRQAEAIGILGRMYQGYKIMVNDGLLDESTYDAYNPNLTDGSQWKCSITGVASDTAWVKLGFEQNPNKYIADSHFCYNIWPKRTGISAQCNNADLQNMVDQHNVAVARRKKPGIGIPPGWSSCDCNQYIAIDCTTGKMIKNESWY